MRVKSIIIVCLVIMGVVSGCSKEELSGKEDHHDAHSASHDIREETTGTDALPSFLESQPEDIQIIYQAAAKHEDLLEFIPCYCGCGETANHKNNYDCFVFNKKENGSLVWDDHGTKCGVCLEIAAQSILDYQEGKSLKEIREKIDTQYKSGYAKPTPTPEV
ncbi:PCYCGC motif-containing (lipo)protein [Bacillus weihaiensis]|uniref:Lipoprotein n=1 Tax=Bacillus weihaiensis TaxID=1547283 RepID=A0A1L3MV19_9BACI|nr:PCYCGC motif-containing (lipo)protein [Bacillus weihaiensis]APH06120.1 hypothetical protein A9C19_15990 [Bacillus weihaiensis]